MSTSPDQDFVLKTIKSRDVHFVRFWFCDVLGHMKSFAVIPSELENAFEEGMGFDGSAFAVLPLRANRTCSHIPKLPRFRFCPGVRSAMLLDVCSAPLKRPKVIISTVILETC